MTETTHYRPQAHFTPRAMWMNDPNGLLFHKGRYHFFFQHNPTASTWGNIGWGHAVSSDLVTWEELPMALHPTDQEMAFSGSVVWDRDNISGLSDGTAGPLLAFYTSAYTEAHPTRPGEQAQSIAYSLDDGATWERYPGNPVLARGSDCFRDPKVFWHEPSQRWVMVVVEADHRQMLIYSSADLLHWDRESVFGPVGEEGIQWECPDLLRVPVAGGGHRWVLLLSTNPGGFAGGSGMRYFVGDFDGRSFTPHDGSPRWLDHGPDCYAAVSFHGVDRPLIIGWMSNWIYANEAPTHPWRSAMTLARELTLVERDGALVLSQQPVLPAELGVTRTDFTLVPGAEVVLEWGGSSRCVVRRRSDGGLVVDRSTADPHQVHDAIPATPPIPLPEGPVSGVLLEDHGLIELYLADGTVVVTMQTFPEPGPARVSAG